MIDTSLPKDLQLFIEYANEKAIEQPELFVFCEKGRVCGRSWWDIKRTIIPSLIAKYEQERGIKVIIEGTRAGAAHPRAIKAEDALISISNDRRIKNLYRKKFADQVAHEKQEEQSRLDKIRTKQEAKKQTPQLVISIPLEHWRVIHGIGRDILPSCKITIDQISEDFNDAVATAVDGSESILRYIAECLPTSVLKSVVAKNERALRHIPKRCRTDKLNKIQKISHKI